jgi:hypothetical protein
VPVYFLMRVDRLNALSMGSIGFPTWWRNFALDLLLFHTTGTASESMPEEREDEDPLDNYGKLEAVTARSVASRIPEDSSRFQKTPSVTCPLTLIAGET